MGKLKYFGYIFCTCALGCIILMSYFTMDNENDTAPEVYRSRGTNIKSNADTTSKEHILSVSLQRDADAVQQVPGDNKTRVILFCYMRGGSTYFSELFRQNSKAMYWYEPFTAFYNAYFGMNYWVYPLDVFWQRNSPNNYAFRNLSDWELDKMVEFNNKLLTCQFSALPIDVFYHQGVAHTNFKNFRGCLKTRAKRNDPRQCARFISQQCGGNCNNAITNKCAEKISIAQNYISSGQNGVNISLLQEPFIEYSKCKGKFKQLAMKCLVHLEKKCDQSDIITHKGLRITMESVEKMLESDPHLRVIYDVRDPRGIVTSRAQSRHLFSGANRNIITEAKYLCDKMMQDLKGYNHLKEKFPESVLFVKYEDVAENPHGAVKRIYDFLGRPVHQSVYDWMRRNERASKDGGHYDTRRANSSASIDKWRRDNSVYNQEMMTKHCTDILKALNYTL